MSKPIVATLLALGIGLAASSASHAAAVPAMGSGLKSALTTADTVELAQVIIKNRGGVVVRGGGRAVVGPRGGVAVRRGGTTIVAPRVVAPRRGFVGGGAVVGRPAFVQTRRWTRRPYFGTVVGGIALGSIIAVTAAPRFAPAPGLCWYWVDDYEERGYWDYC